MLGIGYLFHFPYRKYTDSVPWIRIFITDEIRRSSWDGSNTGEPLGYLLRIMITLK